MVTRHNIEIPTAELAEICRRYHVRELALFGLALREDFRDDSDLDILVEFEPETQGGLFAVFDLKFELESLFDRTVDLGEKAGLKRLIRDDVLDSAEVIYAECGVLPEHSIAIITNRS